jgi:RNA polymerase sigma-70 factor (ECF subfamily)
MDSRDPNAIARLYERTGRAALSKTARLVGRVAVAEEIVQDVFLKLWSAELTFPDERAAYAWIYRSCHNAGIDHLRAAATRREESAEPSDLAAHRDLAADATPVRLAQRQLLTKHLSRLDDREAQILGYRVVDGMTQDEIAEVMGVARKTIVRACARLEAKLGEARDIL